MSSGSSNEAHVAKQLKYDEAVHEYGWHTKKLKHTHAKEQYTAQIWNDKNTRQYEYDQRVESWKDAAAIRDFKYANQRAAHNASVKAYNKQLDFNNLAQEISLNDNTRKYNERLTEVGFKNEELLMKMDHTKSLKTQGVEQFKEDSVFKEMGLVLGRKDAAEQAGLDAQAQLNILEKAKADAARKGVDLTMESLKKQGQVRARGQTGRSARKNIQTIISEQGRAQGALVDMITDQSKDYALAFDRIETKLKSYNRKTALDYSQITNAITQTVENANLQIAQQAEGTGLSQRQLKESLKSAKEQKEADDQSIQLKKYSADLSAENSIAPDAQHEPKPAYPVKVPDPVTVPPVAPSEEEHKKVKPIPGVVSKGPSLLSQILSDNRLKYNMNRVGTSRQGVPIYTFKYRHQGKDGPEYIGTSAQDLIKLGREDAVGKLEKEGFYYVDYSKLDLQFYQVPT